MSQESGNDCFVQCSLWGWWMLSFPAPRNLVETWERGQLHQFIMLAEENPEKTMAEAADTICSIWYWHWYMLYDMMVWLSHEIITWRAMIVCFGLFWWIVSAALWELHRAPVYCVGSGVAHKRAHTSWNILVVAPAVETNVMCQTANLLLCNQSANHLNHIQDLGSTT